jgi:hypothetical protein
LGCTVRQTDQLGTSGLYGFMLAFFGNVLTFGGLLGEGFVWPAVALYNPAAVHSFDPNVVAARGSMLLPLLFFTGLALFAVGYVLFGRATMRAGVLPRWGGLLIAIGALLYVVGAFSLPVFGPESPLVTIVETSGAVPFGLGFISLGYTLWRGSEGVQRSVLRQAP